MLRFLVLTKQCSSFLQRKTYLFYTYFLTLNINPIPFCIKGVWFWVFGTRLSFVFNSSTKTESFLELGLFLIGVFVYTVWVLNFRMAGEEEKSNDFYAVLGLKKECTATELKNAYKKLALVRFWTEKKNPLLLCCSFIFSTISRVSRLSLLFFISLLISPGKKNWILIKKQSQSTLQKCDFYFLHAITISPAMYRYMSFYKMSKLSWPICYQLKELVWPRLFIMIYGRLYMSRMYFTSQFSQ